MTKSNFDFEIKEDHLFLEDLNLGNMSLTNDMENVLTYLNKTEIHGLAIEKMKVSYKDSDGRWDSVVPEWIDGRCVSVKFLPGNC